MSNGPVWRSIVWTVFAYAWRFVAAKTRPTNPPIIFLHLGKGGGGSVKQRLQDLHASFRQCHPGPCHDRMANAEEVLINIRDPVDRFKSAFYWRSLKYCNATDHDDRQQDQGGDRNFLNDPEHYCSRLPKKKDELNVLRNKYHMKANLLAEALFDQGPEIAAAAENDLSLIGHAKNSIADWLGESWEQLNITAIVLEPGYDFDSQTDAAILHALSRIHRERFLGNVLHSSNAINVTKLPLSDIGVCCVARQYSRDYELIKRLKQNACHGQLADTCRAALQSILDRRAKFLDQEESCRTLVTQGIGSTGMGSTLINSGPTSLFDSRKTFLGSFILLLCACCVCACVCCGCRCGRGCKWMPLEHIETSKLAETIREKAANQEKGRYTKVGDANGNLSLHEDNELDDDELGVPQLHNQNHGGEVDTEDEGDLELS